MEDIQEVEPILLRISASKEPGYAKKVASAMLWRLRDCDGYCKARTMREAATNTAIKAIAICNQRVAHAAQEETDVILGVDFHFSRPEGVTAIDMLIGDVGKPNPSDTIEFRVSGREDSESLNAKLAEAISSACLDGKRVFLKCIGPSAVYRAVIASTIAKGSLFASGLSSVVVPTWDSIPVEGSKPISLISMEFRSFVSEQEQSI